MGIVTGQFYVPNPNPVVPRYGLFQVATGPLDLPQHARSGGLNYETSVCNLPLGYTVNCQASHASKSFNGSIATKTGFPFVVYAGIECGVVGLANWGQDRIHQYLYNMLAAGEQAAVENIFSQSANGQTEGLANNPAVVNLGTAQGPVQAVSKLEDWLYARYGLPGVIHVPMRGSAYMHSAFSLMGENVKQPNRTTAGSYISFGNYAGLGPTGQTPLATETWIYITGQVAVWRTSDAELQNIPMSQVINRTTNTVDMLLEREYVVTYDCFVACVLTTLNTTDR